MTATKPEQVPQEKSSGSKKKKLILLVAVLLVVAAGAYWFVLKPKPAKEPEKGEVAALEPIQINLAEGHYLRLVLALQLSADVKEEVDGSEALATAVDMLSGLPVEEFAKPEGRRKIFAELTKDVLEHYEGELLDLYVTEAVTQ
ncbi:MAG: flagellar basal body-associated FliL family protein [Dietzia sp.]|nr:flagellar basal body-associated FliL family protein [Dietzia sp.]